MMTSKCKELLDFHEFTTIVYLCGFMHKCTEWGGDTGLLQCDIEAVRVFHQRLMSKRFMLVILINISRGFALVQS